MYSVVVGNVGTVHETNSEYEARITFGNYVLMSVKRHGRIAGEAVTLWHNYEPIEHYEPEALLESY